MNSPSLNLNPGHVLLSCLRLSHSLLLICFYFNTSHTVYRAYTVYNAYTTMLHICTTLIFLLFFPTA